MTKIYSCEKGLEETLRGFVKDGFLLHGTQHWIGSAVLRPYSGKVHATDAPVWAMMRSLVSNKNLRFPGLQYYMNIADDDSFVVNIHGCHQNTIAAAGWVYVLSREGFVRTEETRQFTNNKEVPIFLALRCSRKDYNFKKHPMYAVEQDGSRKKIIL